MTHWPLLNASLNACAGIFLLSGWLAIRKGKQQLHRNCMLAALAMSFLFLCSYLTYHAAKDGAVTHYEKEGLLRIVYFLILLTHTPLAALIVPFSLTAVWFAYKGQFGRHVKITRWLYPAWMYVSVTGVLIYLMLYVF